MALYRALPTATVFDIADAIELKFVMKKAVRMKGVKYIRAGRGRMVKIYNEDSKLQIGKGLSLIHIWYPSQKVFWEMRLYSNMHGIWVIPEEICMK